SPNVSPSSPTTHTGVFTGVPSRRWVVRRMYFSSLNAMPADGNRIDARGNRLRGRSECPGSGVLGKGAPPLAPPFRPDQDPQLLVPAVGDVVVRLEVVPAVLALLVSGGLALQDGI